MGFADVVPAQRESVAYLQDAAKRADGILRVGGHSKGGNLAVYAARVLRGRRARPDPGDLQQRRPRPDALDAGVPGVPRHRASHQDLPAPDLDHRHADGAHGELSGGAQRGLWRDAARPVQLAGRAGGLRQGGRPPGGQPVRRQDHQAVDGLGLHRGPQGVCRGRVPHPGLHRREVGKRPVRRLAQEPGVHPDGDLRVRSGDAQAPPKGGRAPVRSGAKNLVPIGQPRERGAEPNGRAEAPAANDAKPGSAR
jgi:hypothetical protein